MIKFSIEYIVPEGDFCEINSRRATSGKRVLEVPNSCFYVLRSYHHGIEDPDPVELRCRVFNTKLYHRPGVGVHKCQDCLKKHR